MVCRAISKRSKWLKAVRDPTFPLPIEIMVAARLSPSGLASCYRAIPFAFPAAIELESLNVLSDALVCHRRHDRYAVVSEKKLFLTGAKADVDSYLERWRKAVVSRVYKAFELFNEAEVEKFGEILLLP